MTSLASGGGHVNGLGRNGRARSGTAKTFDNGIQVLECLSRHPEGRIASEIAREVGLDRTVVYRLLNTALDYHLARVDSEGRYVLGFGLLELGAAVSADVREAAGPHLAQLAEEHSATAFLTVADGDDAVSVAVRVPRSAPLHVAYRTGFRHRLGCGAPGLAILAARPPQPAEREEVTRGRRDGFVVTHGELQPGAWGIAAPVPITRIAASVGLVMLAAGEPMELIPALHRAAEDLARALG